MTEDSNIAAHVVTAPEWLTRLLNKVSEAVEPISIMGPLAYRWLEPNSPFNLDTAWLLAVYPTPNEAYGGEADGQLMCPGFQLNLQELLGYFTAVHRLAWRSPSVYTGDLDGPEITIRGCVEQHQVQLRIFSIPPDDEQPSLLVNLASGRWREKA